MSTTLAPHSPAAKLRRVEDEVRKVLVGQQVLMDRLLVALLARGHVLIEGVPGLAKTLTVKTLARALHLDFRRVQFTPDLLPADLVGTLIYDQRSGAFTPRRGPVFTHILLADEINRAPAKVQSALLECMEERQVTLGDATHSLAEPFMVLATQNPLEQEGTYPLAEAQVDRFLMKLVLDYPSREEESQILDRMLVEQPAEVEAVLDVEALLKLRQAADSIYLAPALRGYILDLVGESRESEDESLRRWIAVGASPRATLYLARSAKAHALLAGRNHALPEDVKAIAPEVLRHRLMPSFEAEAEGIDGDYLVNRILDRVDVP
ncbi:MAG: AAA family ATPase [Acidobacteriota bacterium]